MKLFVFVDLHANPKIFEKIKRKVKKEKPDLILCAGDLAAFGYGTQKWLKQLDSLKIPTFVIPGNHETEEEMEIYSKKLKFIKNIHLKSVLFNSVLFIGCGGGGFTEEHTEFERSEKEFARDIKKLKVKNHKHKIILLTHQPPHNTKLDYLWWTEDYAGSTSIRKFIEKYKPVLCVTGHLHENFGKEDKIGKTRIVNPGPEGKFIEI